MAIDYHGTNKDVKSKCAAAKCSIQVLVMDDKDLKARGIASYVSPNCHDFIDWGQLGHVNSSFYNKDVDWDKVGAVIPASYLDGFLALIKNDSKSVDPAAKVDAADAVV